MKPTNGKWWPEKAPWEGGGKVPCRGRGKESQSPQAEAPGAPGTRCNLFLLRWELGGVTRPNPNRLPAPISLLGAAGSFLPYMNSS